VITPSHGSKDQSRFKSIHEKFSCRNVFSAVSAAWTFFVTSQEKKIKKKKVSSSERPQFENTIISNFASLLSASYHNFKNLPC